MVAGLAGTLLSGALLCFTANAASAEGPLKLAGGQFEPVKWSELAGWAADDHLAAFAAYQAGCRVARRRPRSGDRAQISEALSNVCRKALDLQPQDSDSARIFFEQNFQPVRVARLGENAGLVTGYYEPIVAGSRFPSPEFPVPLYRRPRDLVAAGYQQGSTAFPNKGGRIGRRTEGNEIVPYYDRGAIEAGALDGQKLEICWIKDPLDLITIQIEGSARVILEDGTPLRISYDSHNGYGYSSIERVLVERNVMSRQEMSRARIRAWTAAHPEEAAKVRAANRSYMFFRITGLTNDSEPIGAQGVPLTPGRSIAVDRVHEYGTPFFIEGNFPVESAKPTAPFGRLMIAQDTGSAIVGTARADLYLGAGDEAGRIAGRIRHPGRFTMLLPREFELVATGSELPLPVPKPKIAEVEVAQADAKQDDDKNIATHDDRGKPAASVVAAAPGKLKPMPVPVPMPLAKTRIAVVEVGKPERKGRAESAAATTDGRHLPASSKSKIAVVEVRKQDGKGRAEANAVWTVAGKQKSSSGAKTSGANTRNAVAEVKNEAGKPNGKGKSDAAKSGATGKPMSGPKTKVVETEGRNEAGKQGGKGKSADAGKSTAGKIAANKSSGVKSKTAEADAKKPNGKGKAESAKAADDGRASAKPGRQAAAVRKNIRSVN